MDGFWTQNLDEHLSVAQRNGQEEMDEDEKDGSAGLHLTVLTVSRHELYGYSMGRSLGSFAILRRSAYSELRGRDYMG